jgi:hypothetical protein
VTLGQFLEGTNLFVERTLSNGLRTVVVWGECDPEGALQQVERGPWP